MKDDFRPYVVYDAKTKKFRAVNRDQFGDAFSKAGASPDLRTSMNVKLLDGVEVEVRTVFSLTEQYLNKTFTPKQTALVTVPTW